MKNLRTIILAIVMCLSLATMAEEKPKKAAAKTEQEAVKGDKPVVPSAKDDKGRTIYQGSKGGRYVVVKSASGTYYKKYVKK